MQKYKAKKEVVEQVISKLQANKIEKSNPNRDGLGRFTFGKILLSPDYDGKNLLHKSFIVNISEVTENNKTKKVEQVEKALSAIYQNKPFIIKHIKADDSKRHNDIIMQIKDFDKNKINKSVRTLSFSLDTPLKAVKGEAFNYKSQEQLTNKHTQLLTDKTKEVYSFLINYFGLPEKRIVQKADLMHKGKIVYNPETGLPISEAQWKKFVEALQKFIDKVYKGTGEKIVLDSVALGRILDRMTKESNFEAVKNKTLEDLKVNGKSYDWISDSVKNMKNALGESLDRYQQARIEVMQNSAAQKITKVTDTMRNDIQQILIDGVKNKETKSKVSQNLFDKCVGLNKDFQKIADTEIQNTVNNAYIQEEIYHSKEGEKVYFRRMEILDDNTCKKCKELRGKIVLWSEYPLESSHIKDDYADLAMWEGSGENEGEIPIGTVHPYCRGSWYRYYPEVE